MALSHVFSSPIADGTNTQLVKPSDWNSAHNIFQTLSGNVAGNSTVSGTNIIYQGGNNVTLSGTGQTVVFSVPSQTNFVFSNANGVSFGTNGSTVTASHNGITVQSVQPVAYSAANGSANFSTIKFADSNGVSFSTGTQGVYATVATNYQSQGAYLTTARASNDGIGLNTALTANGVSVTANSSGLSLNFPAFLTTAAQSNHSHGNPTLALTNLSGTTASNSAGFTLSLSAGAGGAGDGVNILAAGTQTANTTGTVLFNNANGVTFGMSNNSVITASHNGITVQSLQPVAYSAANGSANFSTLQFANSNGVSFSTGTQGLYATVKTDYLTTARASNDAIGLNTALTANGVSVTANSSGLSLNFPAFLTTAAQSNHSHGNPTLALTNLTGTTASASNGFTISLSAAAPGAAAENNWFNLQGNTASNSTASGSTIMLSAGNNITLAATNGSVIRIDAAAGGGGFTNSTFIPYYPFATSTRTMGAQGTSTASIHFFPMSIEHDIAFNNVRIQFTNSHVTSSVSGRQTVSWNFGLYSLNGTNLSLISSNSVSFGVTNSSVSATINYPSAVSTSGYGYGTIGMTTTAQIQSLFGTAGDRLFEMQFGGNMTLTEGLYWLGLHQRQSSSSANVGFNSALKVAPMYATGLGPLGSSTIQYATNALYNWGWGVFTSTGTAGHSGTALFSPVPLSGISQVTGLMPLVTFIST